MLPDSSLFTLFSIVLMRMRHNKHSVPDIFFCVKNVDKKVSLEPLKDDNILNFGNAIVMHFVETTLPKQSKRSKRSKRANVDADA